MLASDFFSFEKSLATAYQRACAGVCRKYALSQTALDIVLFIANNPNHNTARDLCELRGIKSGIASVSVESLMRAGLLARACDPQDRRVQRLQLTPSAAPLVDDGRASQKQFCEALFRDVTPEEWDACARTLEKLVAAARRLPSATQKEDKL